MPNKEEGRNSSYDKGNTKQLMGAASAFAGPERALTAQQGLPWMEMGSNHARCLKTSNVGQNNDFCLGAELS